MNDRALRNFLSEHILARLRKAFTHESPNHRIASIIGGSVFVIVGSWMSTTYYESCSTLIPDLPWVGHLFPWGAAGLLDFLAVTVAWKSLDRFRPNGKRWPDHKDQGPKP